MKGDEFDCVVLFVPKPHSKNAPCPSEEWWPASSSEERRIAFVAASRAKKTLIMCVHRNTYDALKEKRPKFVALFQQVKRRQRTHAASGGASEALPHEVGARPSRSEPKFNTHALYPSRSELRGITFKNK